MNDNRGLLVVVSGPSGAGKGTVLGCVLKRDDKLQYSVSVTTRKPREGEVDGVNYFFKTKEEYNDMLANDAFLETQQVYDNFYGTPKEYVENLRSQGIDVMLEIDVKGAMQIKRNVKDAVFIFLTPPSVDVLRARLTGRATETKEQLRTRLNSSISELSQIDQYEYVVINDDKDKCVDDVLAIIHAERCKVQRNSDFIKNLVK